MKESIESSSNAAPNFPVAAMEKMLVSQQRRQKVVETAMAFPMDDVLRRYAKDNDLPWDVVVEHEREVKRFLSICAMNPGKPVGMSGLIDELWHTFVMFTREYHNFSYLVAGRYLHHSPSSESEDPEFGRQAYKFFWEEYCASFGEEPPAHLWPNPISAKPEECYNACEGLCSCNNLCSCIGVPCGCYA